MVVLLIGVVVASPTRRSTARQIDITRQTFPVTDRAYSDESLARLYDVLNPWGPSDDFYLDLVMSAGAVLDVGCGTGALLRRARDCGHTGRLCGLDPATAMLDQARRLPDIEWVLGDVVRFTTTFASQAWTEPRVSRSSLRFLTVDSLRSFLSDSELVVEEQFGDWACGPLRESSPEIITLARRS
jgi:SAM-dependent methyltransferase